MRPHYADNALLVAPDKNEPEALAEFFRIAIIG